MDPQHPSHDPGRGGPLRIAATTLIIAVLMYAVIGHFAGELNRTRLEQLRIADLDRSTTSAVHGLSEARMGDGGIPTDDDRDAAAAALEDIKRFEDRAGIIGLLEAADGVLASVDLQMRHLREGDGARAANDAATSQSVHERLRTELTALDRRCQERAETAVRATALSVLATLLLSSALVAFFAARHGRRSTALASLEVQGQLSDARERRFRLLLEVEEATRDLTDPEGVADATMRLLEGFLGAARCACETPEAQVPPLTPDEWTALRLGRVRIEGSILRCPLLRDGALAAVVSAKGERGRVWNQGEIALVEEVAARYGAYVERTEADAAKRHSRWTSALLDAQLNASPDGIVIVDREYNRVLQNRRMAEVWGIPEDVIDDLDGKRQFTLLQEAVVDREAFLEPLAMLVRNPESFYRGEIELRNGTVIERYSGPAVGSDGIVYGRIWNYRDVTDRIRNERALIEAQEELEARVESRTRDLAAATKSAERANAAKSEFLSRMSHELRTPLNAILGFGGILAKQPLAGIQRESVEFILKGGRHLLGLINEVLDISRVETGHAELSIEPVPLAEILEESFAMVRTMADERGIRLEEGLDAMGDLHLVADRQRLKQVFINLLSNAVKYNRPNGRVAARFEAEEGRVRLAIEDTGVGISAEGIAKLFVPFERLEAAATGVEGTGLGLFLTQKLVAAMGGTLRVESVLGEGTSFIVELEIARSPSEALTLVEGGLADSVAIPADEGRDYTILSIEDNSANVRLLQRIFEHRPNVHLVSATCGLEGLEAARKGAPDLVLLDLNLPDVSGFEILARLQRSALTRDIPVVVVSADASAERVAQSLRAGATEFLAKPLDVDRFLRVVDAALRGEPIPASIPEAA